MTGKLTLSFDITVAWKRSSVWGACPTAEATATLYEGNVPRRRDTGMGHASGCGYDKRSAAVNKALYDLPLLQTLLLWRGSAIRLRGLSFHCTGCLRVSMVGGLLRVARVWGLSSVFSRRMVSVRYVIPPVTACTSSITSSVSCRRLS